MYDFDVEISFFSVVYVVLSFVLRYMSFFGIDVARQLQVVGDVA